MNDKTKTALGALGITLLSMFCLYLIAFSNQITRTSVIAGIIILVIFDVAFSIIASGTVGSIVGGIFAVIIGVIVGSVVGGNVGGIFAIIAGGTIGGIFAGIVSIAGKTKDKTEKKVSIWPIVLLCVIFILPLCVLTVPLSKYHNQNQLERDQRIAEILQITVQEDGIEVLLPSEYASENSYLEKVLFLGWEKEKKQEWEKAVIACQEGKKFWYKVELALPEGKSSTANLVLFFDHAWQDHKETKQISLSLP